MWIFYGGEQGVFTPNSCKDCEGIPANRSEWEAVNGLGFALTNVRFTDVGACRDRGRLRALKTGPDSEGAELGIERVEVLGAERARIGGGFQLLALGVGLEKHLRVLGVEGGLGLHCFDLSRRER